MTGKIFESFLATFDRFVKTEKEMVVLMVYSVSCHSVRANLANLTLKFLPSNVTAELQPLDTRIIRAIKAH